MTSRRPRKLSSGSLPLPIDFIDLTDESNVYKSSKTSNSLTVGLQHHLDTELEKSTLDETVTLDTSVTPSTSGTRSGTRNASRSETRNASRSGTRNTSRSGTRNASRSGTGELPRSCAALKSMITSSNKSRSSSSKQRRDKAKPNKIIINLDDTVLPQHSSLWDTDDSTSLICAICLEKLLSQRKPTATRCGHIFCEECLNQVIVTAKICPQCRTSITKKSCIRLHF